MWTLDKSIIAILVVLFILGVILLIFWPYIFDSSENFTHNNYYPIAYQKYNRCISDCKSDCRSRAFMQAYYNGKPVPINSELGQALTNIRGLDYDPDPWQYDPNLFY